MLNVEQGLNAYVMTITPDMAKKFLGDQDSSKQRSLNPRKLNQYTLAMKKREWQPNGETIQFNRDGIMINGNHRCHACVRSDNPFTTLVVYNVDDEYRETIDTGQARSSANLLAMNGLAYSSNLASTVLFLLNLPLDGGMVTRKRFENRDIYRWIEENPAIIPIVENFGKIGRRKSVARPSVLSALFWILSRIDSVAAENFFVDLIHGAGLEYDDPVLAARNRLLSLYDGKFKQEQECALILRAWSMRRKGLKANGGRITGAVASRDNASRMMMPRVER